MVVVSVHAALPWVPRSLTSSALLRAVQAQQANIYKTFPFCKCSGSALAYTLDTCITAHGNGIFCYTIITNAVDNASNFCATAPVKKLEVRVWSMRCAVITVATPVVS